MPLAWMILSSTQRCSSKRLTTGSPWGDRLDQSRPAPRCVDPATWGAAGAEPPVAITAPAAAAKGPVCKKARRSISFLQASRLINSVPAGHGSNDSNVLDLGWIHRVRIVGEDDEICKLACRNGAFECFFMRRIRTIDCDNPQRFVDADALVATPGLAIPPRASHHSLNTHEWGEWARTKIRAGGRRYPRVGKGAVGHGPLHQVLTVKLEFVGVVIPIRREWCGHGAGSLDAP